MCVPDGLFVTVFVVVPVVGFAGLMLFVWILYKVRRTQEGGRAFPPRRRREKFS
jgi:hypothetical protein